MQTTFKKAIPVVVLSVMIAIIGFVPTLSVNAENTVGKTLVVKKVLTKADQGVTTPAENFSFTAEAHSFNGAMNQKTECPALTSVTSNYDGTEDTDADAAKPGKQLNVLSGDMLDGVNFTKAGQYTYTVKEIAGTTEGMTYSKAEYLASLMVVKSGDGKFTVEKIMIKKIKDDEGKDVTNDSKTEYNPEEANNNLAFNNVYDKKDGNDNPGGGEVTEPDKKGFVVNKVVATATDASFGFKLTLVAPAGATQAAVDALPTAKIIKADGTLKETVTMSAYGTSTEFTLKKGERLVLADVLLGSTAKVEESDTQGFTPTVEANGVSAVNDVDTLKNNGVILSDAGNNYATVTNTEQTLTGILMSNLPLILLFVIAAGGIAVYARNRRKANSEI